jgi:hypothetical protein
MCFVIKTLDFKIANRDICNFHLYLKNLWQELIKFI